MMYRVAFLRRHWCWAGPGWLATARATERVAVAVEMDFCSSELMRGTSEGVVSGSNNVSRYTWSRVVQVVDLNSHIVYMDVRNLLQLSYIFLWSQSVRWSVVMDVRRSQIPPSSWHQGLVLASTLQL